MALILTFPGASGAARATARQAHAGGAEILIFTGVRYERWSQGDESPAVGNRARRRRPVAKPAERPLREQQKPCQTA